MLLPRYTTGVIEAGCDEAGRGCLAGPVFAAAVVLPHDFYHPLLNDSKKLSEAQRATLRPIIEQQAVAWAVCSADVAEIDTVNILRASFGAMHRAINALQVRPELLLIDGHIFPPYMGISHQCIVKGDGKYAAIAAASILAKTHRDEHMLQLHRQYPQYGWERNKGYGTPAHMRLLRQHGLTPHHRLSFEPCTTMAAGQNG